MGVCEKCGKFAQREQGFARETKRYAELLIPVLRFQAESYGYCLATHGSMNWDIDIVLVPWRERPIDPQHVIERFKEIVKAVIGFEEDLRAPTKKPCGRLAWSLHLTHDYGGGPYLDISVMTVPKEPADTADYPWLAGEAK